MKRKRGISVIAAGAVLAAVILPTSAAFAISDSGFKGCSGGTPYSYLRTQTTGTVTQKGPGGSYSTFVNGSNFPLRITQGATYGGSWAYSTTGSVYVDGTYPYCASYT